MSKAGNDPGVGKCPAHGQCKICKCPTSRDLQGGQMPGSSLGGGGEEDWAQVELTMHKDQFVASYFLQVVILLLQIYNWEIRHHSLVCHRGLADILYILVSFFKLYFQYATSLRHASKTRVELFLLSQSCRDLTRYEAWYENTTTTTTNK